MAMTYEDQVAAASGIVIGYVVALAVAFFILRQYPPVSGAQWNLAQALLFGIPALLVSALVSYGGMAVVAASGAILASDGVYLTTWAANNPVRVAAVSMALSGIVCVASSVVTVVSGLSSVPSEWSAERARNVLIFGALGSFSFVASTGALVAYLIVHSCTTRAERILDRGVRVARMLEIGQPAAASDSDSHSDSDHSDEDEDEDEDEEQGGARLVPGKVTQRRAAAGDVGP